MNIADINQIREIIREELAKAKIRPDIDASVILAFAEIKGLVEEIAADTRHKVWSADQVDLAEHIVSVIKRNFEET